LWNPQLSGLLENKVKGAKESSGKNYCVGEKAHLHLYARDALVWWKNGGAKKTRGAPWTIIRERRT